MLCDHCHKKCYMIYGPVGQSRCNNCGDGYVSHRENQKDLKINKSMKKIDRRFKVVPPDHRKGIAGGVFARNDGKEF